jgi:hypothetical protein
MDITSSSLKSLIYNKPIDKLIFFCPRKCIHIQTTLEHCEVTITKTSGQQDYSVESPVANGNAHARTHASIYLSIE